MRYLSSDYILPISSESIQDGVIVVDDDGKIEAIGTLEEYKSCDIEKHHGVLMPGMINTHCHLELSHMKDQCISGTTLIPFITDVVTKRDTDIAIVKEKIAEEDANMWKAGIQAVGDISNKSDTAEQKSKSPIAYYTFVEMFDLLQESITDSAIEQYRNAYKDQSHDGLNKRSFVPHAPYSVTPALFDFINRANPDNSTISIHNQETIDEHLLFKDGSGLFKSFFVGFNLTIDNFQPIGKTSIHYVLSHMQAKRRNLFVHNTLTSEDDIMAAHQWSDNVYWATCPNANLYIENRLPFYKNFLNQKAKMTIGTDSIMSNWQLSVWEEVKTIKKYQSYVPLSDLIQWATINGAEALGYHNSMGSLEVGKSPGIVQIDIEWKGDDTDIRYSNPTRVI